MKYILSLLICCFLLPSCMDLEVENINDPDTSIVLDDPEGVKALSGGLFKQWLNCGHDASYSGTSHTPAMAMWYMSDHGTTFWSNFAAVDYSTEPRQAFVNDMSYSYWQIGPMYYRNVYDVLTTSTDVVDLLKANTDFYKNPEDYNMVLGMALLAQGLSNGYLGLIFDKCFAIESAEDFNKTEFDKYDVLLETGVSQLEEAIEIFDNSDFTIPGNWITGATWSNNELAQLTHSMIARLLVYGSRNKQQNEGIDWDNVLHHTENGIKEDFAPLGDGVKGSWKSYYYLRTADQNWGKIDMRIVNMLDTRMPSTFPESGLISDLPDDGVAISDDARLATDFKYDPNNSKPERGYYRWTSYSYARLDAYIENQGANEFIPEFRLAESELFQAEALCHLKRYDEAAAIVNAGTRVTRGQLEPVGNTEQEIMDAIWYEQNIELLLSGFGIQYFSMRRHDMLQKGTFLHFPVPSQQLELMGEDVYTYGGTEGVPGEDYSIGGWK